ncbi:MAG: LapA family protein [Alphaproteobacteria bacterium]
MTRLISWIIMLPLLVAVVAFTVSNRGRVTIDLWPLPFSYDLPVFAIGMGGVFLGFLFGAIVAWVSGGKTRAFGRQLMRSLDSSRREEAHLKEQIRKLEATPPASAPALPGKRSDAA